MDATPGRHTRDSAFPVADVPVPKVDPKSFKGRAPAQKVGMSFFHVIECTGCCYFVILTYPSGKALIEFINASTGWNLTMEDVLKTGERVADIRHAFNIREGLNLIDYKTPDRMLGNPPLKAGPLAGITIDEEMIVREFCEEMEWDLKTAKPSKKRLLELGMEDVAKVLYP